MNLDAALLNHTRLTRYVHFSPPAPNLSRSPAPRVRAAKLTGRYLFRDPAWQSLMTSGIREWKQQEPRGLAVRSGWGSMNRKPRDARATSTIPSRLLDCPTLHPCTRAFIISFHFVPSFPPAKSMTVIPHRRGSNPPRSRTLVNCLTSVNDRNATGGVGVP